MQVILCLASVFAICIVLASLMRCRRKAMHIQDINNQKSESPPDEDQSEYEYTGCIMTRSGKTHPIIEKRKS